MNEERFFEHEFLEKLLRKTLEDICDTLNLNTTGYVFELVEKISDHFSAVDDFYNDNYDFETFLHSLHNDSLRNICRKLRVAQAGCKADLVERIIDYEEDDNEEDDNEEHGKVTYRDVFKASQKGSRPLIVTWKECLDSFSGWGLYKFVNNRQRTMYVGRSNNLDERIDGHSEYHDNEFIFTMDFSKLFLPRLQSKRVRWTNSNGARHLRFIEFIERSMVRLYVDDRNQCYRNVLRYEQFGNVCFAYEGLNAYFSKFYTPYRTGYSRIIVTQEQIVIY